MKAVEWFQKYAVKMTDRTSNAFTNPSSGKIDQQRKILEELEKRKKQLNQQSGSGLVSNNSMNNSNNSPSATPTTTTTSSSTIHMTQPPLESQHLLNNNQRAALEVANKSSFGYFIPQDSNFGNLILPVIPRQQQWSIKMKLRDLETHLQQVEVFDKPKVLLEQYPTRPHIGHYILHVLYNLNGVV